MAKKTIAQLPVDSKRVLCRVDFNVPIEDDKITDDRRIREAIPTLQSVLSRGGSLILMSHLGRPEGNGYEAEYSLKPVAARLSELLKKPVAFPSTDCADDVSAAAVKAAKKGDVVLLENVRFAKGEKKGDPAYASRLASYGDIYVNDAFGTAHRTDGSMFAVPQVMKAQNKPCVAGLLLEKELKYLHAALASPVKPFVVVLGGAKVSDKIGVIENLLPKASAILIGGAMAYTFLAALGRKVGSSKVETDKLPEANRLVDAAAKANCQLHLPTDHICATEFSESAPGLATFENDIKDGFMGLDIGPKTQVNYAGVLHSAKTIVWNGPMGVFEWKPFSAGTRAVANAIVAATQKTGATSIVGGGDSAAAAEAFGLADKFSHVSTGGGASLEMLAGNPFKSVDLLDEA